jgi:hypothetical protein
VALLARRPFVQKAFDGLYPKSERKAPFVNRSIRHPVNIHFKLRGKVVQMPFKHFDPSSIIQIYQPAAASIPIQIEAASNVVAPAKPLLAQLRESEETFVANWDYLTPALSDEIMNEVTLYRGEGKAFSAKQTEHAKIFISFAIDAFLQLKLNAHKPIHAPTMTEIINKILDILKGSDFSHSLNPMKDGFLNHSGPAFKNLDLSYYRAMHGALKPDDRTITGHSTLVKWVKAFSPYANKPIYLKDAEIVDVQQMLGRMKAELAGESWHFCGSKAITKLNRVARTHGNFNRWLNRQTDIWIAGGCGQMLCVDVTKVLEAAVIIQ